jgi:hypothetical protein
MLFINTQDRRSKLQFVIQHGCAANTVLFIFSV